MMLADIFKRNVSVPETQALQACERRGAVLVAVEGG